MKEYLLLYIIVSMISGSNWFHRYFGVVNLDQFLFHVRLNWIQLKYVDTALLINFIKNCVAAPVGYSFLIIYLFKFICKVKFLSNIGVFYAGKARLYLSFVILLISSSVYFVVYNIDLPDFSVKNRDWLGDDYRTPQVVKSSSVKKNLILIYVESLERSYDDPIFEKYDLLNNLRFRGVGSLEFNDFIQQSDTGWTIAGIVGTQCGVPLKPVGLFKKNRLGEKIGERANQFLPEATCLGNILKERGYKNVFMGGASLEFSGKKYFLRDHGYDEMYGREEWLEINPDYAMNKWGLNDDDLFYNAKQKVIELRNEKKPFNFTILTVGMHPPEGYLSASCEPKYGSFYDAVQCSTGLVSDFVRWAIERGMLEDTSIIITGDHLSMKNPVTPQLEKVKERSIFNKILTTDSLNKNRDKINHFDLFPTILSVLGIEVQDGRAGLGCSAIGHSSCSSLAEDSLTDPKLHKASEKYNSLWVSQ